MKIHFLSKLFLNCFSLFKVTGIKAKKQKMDSSSKAANPLTAVSMDLDDKRLRLRARIEELQGKGT